MKAELKEIELEVMAVFAELDEKEKKREERMKENVVRRREAEHHRHLKQLKQEGYL